VVGSLTMRTVEATAQGTPAAYECAARSDLVGPCFEVRGRLSFWNGAPSARIWPVGTKRLLGVHSDLLPPALAQTHGFDTELWARFTVCPFTASKPGRMQFVCIDSWRDLTIRHRAD
jgi:hypothetical protein